MEVSFAEGRTQDFFDCFAKDVVWDCVGDQIRVGKENMQKFVLEMGGYTAEKIEIASVIVAENMGSISGTLFSKDGGQIKFCDVIEFDTLGHKIQKITSYAIEIKKV